MKYTTENIDNRIDVINKEYNKTTNTNTKKELEKEFKELNTRAIINSYLYYGYGKGLFIESNYDCAKGLDINKLWLEQVNTLGNMGD